MQRIIIRAFQTIFLLLIVIIVAFLILHINETKKYNELKGQLTNVSQDKVTTSQNASKASNNFIWRPGVDPTPISYGKKATTTPTLFGHEGTVRPQEGIITSGEIIGNDSFQEEIKNLQQTKSLLMQQLEEVTKKLARLRIFMAAQQSLKLIWTKVQTPQTVSHAFNLTIDGNSVQICRASFMNGLHPGIVRPEGCLITYGGYAAIIQSYEILTSNINAEWKRTGSLDPYQKINIDANDTFWTIKSIPIQVGFENNTPLYLCKVSFDNHEYIGKVTDDNCNFAVGSKEIYLKEFEVLFGDKTN